jgi:hypothetical protein
MRIFYSFLIVFISVLFALLPFTGAIHSLLTDIKEDKFTITTAAAATNSTIQLYKPLYDDDISSIEFVSHDTDDALIASTYNSTSRELLVLGFAAGTSRSIDVSYEIDAINNTYFSTAITVATFIWLIMIAVFAVGGLIWLWWGPVKDKLEK